MILLLVANLKGKKRRDPSLSHEHSIKLLLLSQFQVTFPTLIIDGYPNMYVWACIYSVKEREIKWKQRDTYAARVQVRA